MAKVDKRQVWAGRIAACERSGMSRRAWCAANGVAVNSLVYWRRRLRPQPLRARGGRRQALVPIVVRDAARRDAAAASVEIALPGGIVVRAVPTLDVEWLGKLVRELRSC